MSLANKKTFFSSFLKNKCFSHSCLCSRLQKHFLSLGMKYLPSTLNFLSRLLLESRTRFVLDRDIIITYYCIRSIRLGKKSFLFNNRQNGTNLRAQILLKTSLQRPLLFSTPRALTTPSQLAVWWQFTVGLLIRVDLEKLLDKEKLLTVTGKCPCWFSGLCCHSHLRTTSANGWAQTKSWSEANQDMLPLYHTG